MPTDIHGHEVLRLIHQAGSLALVELRAQARQRFGPEARFCTCHAQGMTLEELLQFLRRAGKVIEQDGRLRVVIAEVCSDFAAEP